MACLVNPAAITGRCHCGDVRFQLTPPTDMCSHCHCESCRRLHGAAFVTWTSVPDTQLQLATDPDALHWYESSPGVFWGSCAHCATRLFSRATTPTTDARTDCWYVAVASLDAPLDRAPSAHVSIEETVDWFSVNDGLPRYTGKD